MPVPVAHKVLLALRYFATGTFLRCCGDKNVMMRKIYEKMKRRIIRMITSGVVYVILLWIN
jgi:uncharacterized phage-like protein YoqJ